MPRSREALKQRISELEESNKELTALIIEMNTLQPWRKPGYIEIGDQASCIQKNN